jgi:phospholipase/carboxylesterase
VKRTRIAGLDVVLAGGADREGGGKDAPLVVLLHGYGAPGDDLVPLWRVMRVPSGTRFAFPAAPLETHMMPGYDSRAWWHIDMLAMQQAMARGEMRDLRAAEPEGLTEAREKLADCLTELIATLAPTKLVLGGFSQGSMLALDTALRSTGRMPDGLVILSGTLVAEKIWGERMKALSGVPVFQSHGSSDPILPFALAEELRDKLVASGALVTWEAFRGGHEIPPPVLDKLGGFLMSVLSNPS